MIILEAIEILDSFAEGNDSSSDLNFCSGMLKLMVGMPQDALESFSSANEKCDVNKSEHFLYKGIALIQCGEID